MISNTRQISDPAPADYNRAVLLEVVVDAGYVSGNFFAAGESNTGNFS
jgi:hypothetical protein